MIKFLFKGILRDSSRSRLPIIIIVIGVFLTVVLSSWMGGILRDVVDINAKFTTGHVKVMTRAYAENIDQSPNDLALLEVGALRQKLSNKFPGMEWVERIRFGGLMDVPGENGETKEQGPVLGQAIDLLSPGSNEAERLNIPKSLVTGSLPKKSGEILISHSFAEKLGIGVGSTITFFGSTMNGSMTFQNFTIAGTVSFGISALDRGAIVTDISDAQMVLDMEDAAGEMLGYFKTGMYDDEKAAGIAATFNAQYANDADEFAPVMLRLKEQNDLATLLDYAGYMSGIFVFIFVLAMSIVLWNTGLLGGLRRYQEFGIRLALGEEKGHIFKTLIYEAVLIGIIGSTLGTIVGLGAAFFLQEHGLDFSSVLKNSSMMMPSVYRGSISPGTFYIGFVPGLFSMVLGNALAGIGIYKRETAQLFKELEV